MVRKVKLLLRVTCLFWRKNSGLCLLLALFAKCSLAKNKKKKRTRFFQNNKLFFKGLHSQFGAPVGRIFVYIDILSILVVKCKLHI